MQALSDLDFGGLARLIGVKVLALFQNTTDPSAPADGSMWFDANLDRLMFKAGGREMDVLDELVLSGVMAWRVVTGGTTTANIGVLGPTATGTATLQNVAVTNKFSRIGKMQFRIATASTTAVAGLFATVNTVAIGGGAAGVGGFKFQMVTGIAFGLAAGASRYFMGLTNSIVAPTDVDPFALTNAIGLAWNDAVDSNLHMMFNDASGTATKVNLGASFPIPVNNLEDLYKLEMFAPPGTTQTLYWRVTNIITGAVAEGTQTTDLPATTVLLSPRSYSSVGGVSSITGIVFVRMVLDPRV